MTSLTRGRGRAAGGEARRRAVQELLRARAHLVDVHPAGRPTLEWIQPPFVASPRWPRPHRGVQGRAPSARRPSCSTTRTRSSRPPCPARTPTSTATPRWPGGSSPPASSRAAAVPRLVPDHAGVDILHELSKHKNFGVRTLQAEDEIAGIGAALGAAYAGNLGVTTTSGPGMALKAETMGLAVNLELPLLIIDIQRGGPSTGLPTRPSRPTC